MTDHASTVNRPTDDEIISRIKVVAATPRKFPGPFERRLSIRRFIEMALEVNHDYRTKLWSMINLSSCYFDAVMDHEDDYALDNIEELLFDFANQTLKISGWYKNGDFTLQEPAQLQLIDKFAGRLQPSLRGRYSKADGNDVEKIGIFLQNAIVQIPYLQGQDQLYKTVLTFIIEKGIAVKDIWLLRSGQIIIRRR